MSRQEVIKWRLPKRAEMEIPSSFNSRLKRIDVQNKWANEAVAAMLLIDRGVVYQKFGDQFLRIKCQDFDPYPQYGLSYNKAEMSKELLKEVNRSVKGDSLKWKRRVVRFASFAESLDLHYKLTGETGYKKCQFRFDGKK